MSDSADQNEPPKDVSIFVVSDKEVKLRLFCDDYTL